LNGPLQKGKIYTTRERQCLWKTDNLPPDVNRNTFSAILLAGSMVMFVKFARHRYLQVVYGELVGYIWCGTHISIDAHLDWINPENTEELEDEKARF